MAAPVQPVPSGQPGPQGTPIPRAASTPVSTQPTSQPATPATEGAAAPQPGASVAPPVVPTGPTREQQLIAAQEAVLRDQQQVITRLQQSQRGIEGRVAAIESPGPSRDDQNQAFWKDPIGLMTNLIQTELKKTVDPINQYISGQRVETAYDRAKGRLKTEYGDLWPTIEPEVDRFITAAAQSGNEVNDQLLNVAALAATGAYHRGLLGPTSPQPSGAPPAPPTPLTPAARIDMTAPPHLRPSAPVIPGHEREQKPEARALTENEARLARERGQTPEQFLAWIEVPPDQVVHSKIGRPTS